MSMCLQRAPFVHRMSLLAMCAVAIILIFGCDKKSKQAALSVGATVTGERVVFSGRPQGIRTEPAEKSTNTSLALPGRLVWNEDCTVRVYSPLAGRVVRALVQPGDSVKIGQPLAELASPDFGQVRADARKASSDLLLAQQNLSRTLELNAAGIVADKDLQSTQADFSRADGENIRAQMRLKQVGANSGQNFTLKAPIAGVIVDKAINPGQELRPDQPGAPLFVITDPSRLWVWMDAAEPDIAPLSRAKTGTVLAVNSTAYPNRSFAGKLVKSAAFIDPVSRTFKLRGTVDNTQSELKAEMFVTVAFPIPSLTTNVAEQTIPTSAVLLVGEKRYLFVQEDEKTFGRVEVQVIREQPGRTTITGLGDGKKIVVEGNLYLQQLVLDHQPAQLAPSKKQTENNGVVLNLVPKTPSLTGTSGS